MWKGHTIKVSTDCCLEYLLHLEKTTYTLMNKQKQKSSKINGIQVQKNKKNIVFCFCSLNLR